MSDNKKIIRKIKTVRMFPWLFRKIRKHIPAILVTVLCSAGSAFLGVRFALASKSVIDAAVSGNGEALKARALMLIAIVIGITVCNLISKYLTESLNGKLDKALKSEYILYIMQGDYAVTSSYASGDLLNRLTGDVSNICNGLTSALESLVSLVTVLISTICALSDLSGQIMIILLSISAVMGIGMRLVYRKFMDLHRAVNRANGVVLGFFGEIISKLLIVQGLDISDQMQQRSENILDKRWKIQLRRIRFSVGFSAGLSGVSRVTELFSLLWCAGKLLAGQITFGGLTAVTQLAAKLETPFFMIPSLAKQLFSVFSSAERLQEIENIPPDMPEEDSRTDIPALYRSMRSVSGEHIRFSYGDNNVLDDLSFEIRKGDITVICGTSGIGKSTLLKLLLGIYRPEEGRLFLTSAEGSVPLTRDMRKLFTYAPQGNLLISGTIRDNLTLVRQDATRTEIDEAIYISAMDEYIRTLPNGLDTMLGENGSGISEGQAQRLSLARAFLTGSPVLLLDEITSSLDEETEKKIIERLKALKDRTCIVVTHRSSVRAIADQVLTVR